MGYAGGAISQCLNCSGALYGSVLPGALTCSCPGPLTFSSTYQNCSCGANSVISINRTCLTCPTGSVVLTPLSCFCTTANTIWSDYTKSCLLCGSAAVANSIATSINGVACACTNSSYYFDVFTSKCILKCNNNICNTPIACSSTTSSTTGTSSFVLPGDSLVANLYTLSQNSTAGVNNYNWIRTQLCSCPSGFSWSNIRFGCFPTDFGKV